MLGIMGRREEVLDLLNLRHAELAVLDSSLTGLFDLCKVTGRQPVAQPVVCSCATSQANVCQRRRCEASTLRRSFGARSRETCIITADSGMDLHSTGSVRVSFRAFLTQHMYVIVQEGALERRLPWTGVGGPAVLRIASDWSTSCLEPSHLTRWVEGLHNTRACA